MTDARDRAVGCLFGLACGDAFGRPVEFMTASAIQREHGEVTEMLANGTHSQPAGTITDDTELALCITESLAARRAFDPADVAERFITWLDGGPFDVGLMTRDAITKLRAGASWDEAGVTVWESRPEGSNAGNGSVMRCAPYALAFADAPDRLVDVSRASSAITHADPRCQWGCVILNLTLAGLIRGEPAPLATALDRTTEAPEEIRTALEEVEAVVDGRASADALADTLASSGYVVDTLQTALYDGLCAESAESAITTAVNRGNDTDTVGAIAGTVAGARFGHDALPDRWTRAIPEMPRLRELAGTLWTSGFDIATAEPLPPHTVPE